MKPAWQSWIVLTLGVANAAIIAMLGNANTLGLADQPWLTIVLLPATGLLLVGAANQLKAVGSDAPPVYPVSVGAKMTVGEQDPPKPSQ